MQPPRPRPPRRRWIRRSVARPGCVTAPSGIRTPVRASWRWPSTRPPLRPRASARRKPALAVPGVGAGGAARAGLTGGQGRMAGSHAAEVPAIDGRDPAVEPIADDTPADVGDPVRGEPEVLEDRPRWSRCAEVVEADDRALVA